MVDYDDLIKQVITYTVIIYINIDIIIYPRINIEVDLNKEDDLNKRVKVVDFIELEDDIILLMKLQIEDVLKPKDNDLLVINLDVKVKDNEGVKVEIDNVINDLRIVDQIFNVIMADNYIHNKEIVENIEDIY